MPRPNSATTSAAAVERTVRSRFPATLERTAERSLAAHWLCVPFMFHSLLRGQLQSTPNTTRPQWQKHEKKCHLSIVKRLCLRLTRINDPLETVEGKKTAMTTAIGMEMRPTFFREGDSKKPVPSILPMNTPQNKRPPFTATVIKSDVASRNAALNGSNKSVGIITVLARDA